MPSDCGQAMMEKELNKYFQKIKSLQLKLVLVMQCMGNKLEIINLILF